MRRLESAIEAALAPGHFIGWRSSSAFVSALEDVAAAIEPLIQSAPAEATELFDSFLAGCLEKRDHRRKTGFLGTLDERLARAERPAQSWLERARKRWTSRA